MLRAYIISLPPESMNTLSIPLCTNVAAAFGAILSSSSYNTIIFPGLFCYIWLKREHRMHVRNLDTYNIFEEDT